MLTSVHDRRRYDLDQLATELATYPIESLELYDEGRLRITYSVEWLSDVDLIAVGGIVDAHEPEEFRQLDQIEAKARRVWRGEDTFTAGEAQKILAGLVIIFARFFRHR